MKSLEPWRIYSGRSPQSSGNPGHHTLLHPRRPTWAVLNATALAIAERLRQGGSIEAIAAGLVAAHGIPLERARTDVALVHGRLHQEGLLGDAGAAPPERTPSLDALFLHLTSRCNLGCSHCYALSSRPPEGGHEELATDLVLRLVDELAELGGRSVTLSGGEALLHPGIRAIVRRAAGHGLTIQLLTNGTLLRREWAAFLAEHGVSVQVSIDGSRPEIHDAVRGRGSFLKALQAVERLQAAGLGSKVAICATVMQHNAGDLPDIILLAERIGVPLVRFLPLRRKGRAERAWDEIGKGLDVADAEAFYRLVANRGATGRTATAVSCGLSGVVLNLPQETCSDGIWCPVGRKIDVDVNGDAFPCVLLMEQRFKVGNVRRDSLISLIRSDRMREACQSLVRRRFAIEPCAACLWQNLCQAGCMGQALDNAGTIWAVDDFCAFRQQAYRETFDRILVAEAPESR